MDKIEARAVLAQQLDSYRRHNYAALAKLVGTSLVHRVSGPSGTEYQIEIVVLWDSPGDKTDIRVIGSIDDGSLPGAIFPLSDSFILSSDGGFLGEQ